MNETLIQELEAYAIACDVCASLLVKAPTKESLDALAGSKDLLADEPFVSISAEASQALVGDLVAYEENPEAVLSEYRQDYTFLFEMVSLSKASPFESVYVTEDRTLCGPALLDIRSLFGKWGVKLPEGAATLEDHIGFELSFVSHLLHVALEHVEKDEACDAELEAAGSFIADHINAFAHEYFTQAESVARTDFYKHVMKLSFSLTERLTERFVKTA